MFGELLASVREAGAILRGEVKASRRFVVNADNVRAVRERSSLSIGIRRADRSKCKDSPEFGNRIVANQPDPRQRC